MKVEYESKGKHIAKIPVGATLILIGYLMLKTVLKFVLGAYDDCYYEFVISRLFLEIFAYAGPSWPELVYAIVEGVLAIANIAVGIPLLVSGIRGIKMANEVNKRIDAELEKASEPACASEPCCQDENTSDNNQ